MVTRVTKETKSWDQSFISIAMERSVATRALRVASVVGVVLALINHGNHIFSGAITGDTLWKIALTFAVPYCVSTYSSVLAVRDRLQTMSSDSN